MKTLLIVLAFLVGLIFTMPVYSAPFVYFNWTLPENTQISDYKIVLLGLPGSPIEATFVSASQNDPTYFKAEYDLQELSDGSYTMTGKIKNLWDESPESDPYPFVKAVPGGISNVHLDF